MDFDAPIQKVITVILITVCFPIALTSLNGMNMTGFTATQIALSSLIGLLVSFAFVRIVMKE